MTAKTARREFVAVALLGPYVADCPQCFDAPRRFANPKNRDVWVRRHRADSGHPITIWTDEDAMVALSRWQRERGDLVQQ